jgi:hypothetical protein
MKNAFNAVSQEAIIHQLNNKGCPPLLTSYINEFMKNRFCMLTTEQGKEPQKLVTESGVP